MEPSKGSIREALGQFESIIFYDVDGKSEIELSGEERVCRGRSRKSNAKSHDYLPVVIGSSLHSV